MKKSLLLGFIVLSFVCLVGGVGAGTILFTYCGDSTCDSPSETCFSCPYDCESDCGCGNGQCDMNEDCDLCPSDCGECPEFCGDDICNGNEECSTCYDCYEYCYVTDCGEGTCDSSENCENCPSDCGSCNNCGDGYCDSYEDCDSCSSDCGECLEFCRDDECNDAETCSSCPYDCAGDSPYCSCGDGYCDYFETCGNCVEDCGPCCGDSSCDTTNGETCSTCESDCGTCPYCGDTTCDDDETCDNCPVDCGECTFCGDGECNGGETCFTCPDDCGTCPHGPCIRLDATGTCGSVHLTWSTSDPTRPFDVYRSIGDCANFEEIASTSNLYYDDTAVVVGTSYCYYVESSNTCDSAQTGSTVPSCLPEFPTLAFPLITIIGLMLTVVAVRRMK